MKKAKTKTSAKPVKRVKRAGKAPAGESAAPPASAAQGVTNSQTQLRQLHEEFVASGALGHEPYNPTVNDQWSARRFTVADGHYQVGENIYQISAGHLTQVVNAGWAQYVPEKVTVVKVK